MLSKQTVRDLPSNARFYILLFSLLLSVLIVCWLRTQILSDQLLYIRTQQVFGFISLGFLYVALILSPLSKAVGDRPAMKFWLFSRRAIGVSAFYFAFLHFIVALFGQVGGPDGLGLLPDRFIWALGFGAVALFVLFLMAITSFDKAVRFMTYRKWKWLHRFVYGAGILIILHVWMIGTHMVYGWVQWALFVPVVIFFGLEAWRITGNFAKRFPEFQSKEYFITIFLTLWLLWSLALACLPGLVANYHSGHTEHSQREGGKHGHRQ